MNWTINGTIDFEGSYEDFAASLYNFNQLFYVPLSANNINCICYEYNGKQMFATPIYNETAQIIIGYDLRPL